MSESREKQLISAFSTAWNETVASLLGQSSTLSLLALREVNADGMASALAVAVTWSSAFAASCASALPGILICLFKSEDEEELERLAKQPTDGSPKPGGRALVTATLNEAAARFGTADSHPLSFGPVTFIDFSVDESRLAAIAGDAAWVGTFALSVGDDLTTQALLLYAPHGSLEAQSATSARAAELSASAQAAANAPRPAAAGPALAVSRRNPKQAEMGPRNIERLLDVELDIVVRFGATSMPLRDVVKMGVGTMIELNRGIDEPVELLVNGRHLARGEVVVVDGYYGVRILEIGPPNERALSLA
jgi:flagellar motor switch protein FliN